MPGALERSGAEPRRSVWDMTCSHCAGSAPKPGAIQRDNPEHGTDRRFRQRGRCPHDRIFRKKVTLCVGADASSGKFGPKRTVAVVVIRIGKTPNQINLNHVLTGKGEHWLDATRRVLLKRSAYRLNDTNRAPLREYAPRRG
jgi:hypothetical protein